MEEQPNPNTAHNLREQEWVELAKFHPVIEAWGLEDKELFEREQALKDSVYAVKFEFNSGSPGYCGDLYILQGDALGAEPMRIVRRDYRLAILDN